MPPMRPGQLPSQGLAPSADLTLTRKQKVPFLSSYKAIGGALPDLYPPPYS